MLYVFGIKGTQWCKLGYTSNTNPWLRVNHGFWTNSHPTELCKKLSDLTLLHAFEGDILLETQIKTIFPPDHGEFWKVQRLTEILNYLNEHTTEIPNAWEPITPTADEMMPCCGGLTNICFTCGRSFARWHQLTSHMYSMT